MCPNVSSVPAFCATVASSASALSYASRACIDPARIRPPAGGNISEGANLVALENLDVVSFDVFDGSGFGDESSAPTASPTT
eukprot:8209168-Pyramimonas_sp.AAC.1